MNEWIDVWINISGSPSIKSSPLLSCVAPCRLKLFRFPLEFRLNLSIDLHLKRINFVLFEVFLFIELQPTRKSIARFSCFNPHLSGSHIVLFPPLPGISCASAGRVKRSPMVFSRLCLKLKFCTLKYLLTLRNILFYVFLPSIRGSILGRWETMLVEQRPCSPSRCDNSSGFLRLELCRASDFLHSTWRSRDEGGPKAPAIGRWASILLLSCPYTIDPVSYCIS